MLRAPLSPFSMMRLLLIAQGTLRRSSCRVSAFAPPKAAPVKRSGTTLHAGASTEEPLVTLEDGLHEDEQTIKKSRFIGLAANCASWGAAQDLIAQVRADHPKARHVCFGFAAGVNPVQERASDDGEPTGTGGAPIVGARVLVRPAWHWDWTSEHVYGAAAPDPYAPKTGLGRIARVHEDPADLLDDGYGTHSCRHARVVGVLAWMRIVCV